MLLKLKQIIAQPYIAVDLGTANTRIFAPGFGEIIEQPSFVRYITEKGRSEGPDEYMTYLNSKLVCMPLRGGVIVDIQNAINLLKPLIKRTRRALKPPKMVACAPTDTTEKERELLSRVVSDAGASEVAIIPEIWAAAIGAGLNMSSPMAQMIIDIGEGVTDMAVIRDGSIIFSAAVRTACGDIQRALRTAILSRHKVSIYAGEAERLTHEIESMPLDTSSPDKQLQVDGIDIFKRCRVTIPVSRRYVVGAMEPVVDKIIGAIERALEKIPKTAAAEIRKPGICFSGGGACINGLGKLISLRTGLVVAIAPNPTHAVILGATRMLDHYKTTGGRWKNMAWPKLVSLTAATLPEQPQRKAASL